MESALAASKALADHLGVFVDEYGHLVAPNQFVSETFPHRNVSPDTVFQLLNTSVK
jgi:hypothetical protein